MATPIYTPLVANGTNGLFFSSAKSANYGRYSSAAPTPVNVGSDVVIQLATVNHASPFVTPSGGGIFVPNTTGDYELAFQGEMAYSDTTTQFDVFFQVNGGTVISSRIGMVPIVGTYGFNLMCPGVHINQGSTVLVAVRRVNGAGTGVVIGNLFITLK